MLAKKVALIVVVAALALVPLSAGAQLDPRSKPTIVGPLTYDGDTYEGRKCKDGKFRVNQTSGQVTSSWKFCSFFYRYSAAQDNSSNRDFGAIWLATRIKSTNGWCVNLAISELGVRTSGSGNVLKRAPQGQSRSATASRKVQTRLVVDAGGSGSTHSVAKKNWTLRRGDLAIRKVRKEGFTNLRLIYDGVTNKAIAFAQAFEISWPQGGLPPAYHPELRARHGRCPN